MDGITIIETVGLVWIGWGLGFTHGRARRRRPAGPEAPNYTCGCDHHLSIHDPKTGRCTAGVKTPKYDYVGDKVGYTYPTCACKQYIGPKPPPDLRDLWPDAPKVGD